jgi:hypothetical protein
MVFAMKSLRFPWVRTELIDHLRYLIAPKSYADKDPHFTGVDYAMHFILDDSVLGEDPSSSIGYVLRSNEEAQSVAQLADAMVKLLDRYGKHAEDRALASSPEWASVAKASKSLLELLLSAEASTDG